MQTGFHRVQEQDVACCDWLKGSENARAKCLMQLPGPALLSTRQFCLSTTLETCAQIFIAEAAGKVLQEAGLLQIFPGVCLFDWQGSG